LEKKLEIYKSEIVKKEKEKENLDEEFEYETDDEEEDEEEYLKRKEEISKIIN
jgi:hypothetical protein